jgi:DNA-binding LytR/AlgR family response regulator
MHPTALIADDEPLLRARLADHLAHLWPELRIVAQARNGREALELFDEHEPGFVFLDVHMPGLNGIDAARGIGERAAIVFVTAFEQFAVQAFERGAVDYLVKPFDEARLAETVARLKSRHAASAAAAAPAAAAASADALAPLLDRLAAQIASRQPAAPPRKHLQWIKASVGNSVRLIPVDEVAYLRSDEKYTLVAWAGGEALIRKTLRELADELDPERFVQIHRSVLVALPHVSHVVKGDNETADVHLKGRSEVLPVSRTWLHLFKQM